jgi:hypothetical protein
MVIPHYTYLVLKMWGPNKIIIVKGSFELSNICDKEFHNMAQTFGMMVEYGGPKEGTERSAPFNIGQYTPNKVFDNPPDPKKIWVHTEDRTNLHQTSLGLPSLRRKFIIKCRFLSLKP